MDVVMEVRDLKSVDRKLLKQLMKHSFGDAGWMQPCVDQILDGYAIRGFYNPKTGLYETERYNLAYAKAHAIIAWSDTKIAGWALVRHPSRRISIPKKHYNFDTSTYELTGQYVYGGRRSDFMVYVDEEYRRHRIARKLLLVAYNNFGRMDAYPHDDASEAFYDRNKRFVTQHNTNDFNQYKYESREIF